jgi:hypothetical protein
MAVDVDFQVVNHGSIWQFVCVSEAAQKFAEDELGLEDWQWMGTRSFGIDHRPAVDLVEQLRGEGWVFARG